MQGPPGTASVKKKGGYRLDQREFNPSIGLVVRNSVQVVNCLETSSSPSL